MGVRNINSSRVTFVKGRGLNIVSFSFRMEEENGNAEDGAARFLKACINKTFFKHFILIKLKSPDYCSISYCGGVCYYFSIVLLL